MKRDLQKISGDILDVLVVGGGIHGAAIAYHCARAGFKTALVEQNDFCSATSANSLKILHGGLRYLQHGNIKRMRHSILSRREMMALAPYLVQPLACMMPLHGRGVRGRMAMRTALYINDWVSWDRNQGLPTNLQLPPGRLVSAEECVKAIPGIKRDGLRGAAVWYDALALDTERLVMEYILAGTGSGALAANYAQVTAIDESEDDFVNVSVADKIDNRTYQLRARYVVNAAGPWFNKLADQISGEEVDSQQRWALALNLVVRKQIFKEYAVALEGEAGYQDKDALIKRSKRLYFFVPWQGFTMIGTEYEVTRSGPNDLQVGKETLQAMVDEINAIYPPADLMYDDISFYHAGLLPMQNGNEQDGVQLEKNSSLIESREDERIISLKSVKYTTAPYIAWKVVERLRQRMVPALAGSIAVDSGTDWPEVGSEIRDQLTGRYGQRGRRIIKYLENGKEDDQWLDADHSLLKAEVQYLVNEEMACSLSDIVFRRTGLGTAVCPTRQLLQKAADYMGDLLEWDVERKEREVEGVLKRYPPLAETGS